MPFELEAVLTEDELYEALTTQVYKSRERIASQLVGHRFDIQIGIEKGPIVGLRATVTFSNIRPDDGPTTKPTKKEI